MEIEPTQNILEIKSAYAKQVKRYHPEDKPEEFKELQKAYKSAVKLAKLQDKERNADAFKGTEPKIVKQVSEKQNFADEFKIQEEEKEAFDFREVRGNSLSEQLLKELEKLTMYPYTCNNLEVWDYFLGKEEYQMLYSDADMCKKIQDKICSMWGYKRKTLLFFENRLTQKGICGFGENKKWKKKKSWIRNIHIVSFKNAITREQLQLDKILENQNFSVEEYTEMYRENAEENYDKLYGYYKYNRISYAGVVMVVILTILIFGMSIKVNSDLYNKKRQKREQQYHQEYIDSLKKSVEIQKSE
ncbi:MAG: hypothetical protein ACOCNL_06850 [Acetivibrio ethanolgignens]